MQEEKALLLEMGFDHNKVEEVLQAHPDKGVEELVNLVSGAEESL